MSANVRITLFVFIVLAVTACGGGGGGSSTSDNTDSGNSLPLSENTVPKYTDKNVGLPPFPNN